MIRKLLRKGVIPTEKADPPEKEVEETAETAKMDETKAWWFWTRRIGLLLLGLAVIFAFFLHIFGAPGAFSHAPTFKVVPIINIPEQKVFDESWGAEQTGKVCEDLGCANKWSDGMVLAKMSAIISCITVRFAPFPNELGESRIILHFDRPAIFANSCYMGYENVEVLITDTATPELTLPILLAPIQKIWDDYKAQGKTQIFTLGRIAAEYPNLGAKGFIYGVNNLQPQFLSGKSPKDNTKEMDKGFTNFGLVMVALMFVPVLYFLDNRYFDGEAGDLICRIGTIAWRTFFSPPDFLVEVTKKEKERSFFRIIYVIVWIVIFFCLDKYIF